MNYEKYGEHLTRRCKTLPMGAYVNGLGATSPTEGNSSARPSGLIWGRRKQLGALLVPGRISFDLDLEVWSLARKHGCGFLHPWEAEANLGVVAHYLNPLAEQEILVPGRCLGEKVYHMVQFRQDGTVEVLRNVELERVSGCWVKVLFVALGQSKPFGPLEKLVRGF